MSHICDLYSTYIFSKRIELSGALKGAGFEDLLLRWRRTAEMQLDQVVAEEACRSLSPPPPKQVAVPTSTTESERNSSAPVKRGSLFGIFGGKDGKDGKEAAATIPDSKTDQSAALRSSSASDGRRTSWFGASSTIRDSFSGKPSKTVDKVQSPVADKTSDQNAMDALLRRPSLRPATRMSSEVQDSAELVEDSQPTDPAARLEDLEYLIDRINFYFEVLYYYYYYYAFRS
jgi:hypothetical protein